MKKRVLSIALAGIIAVGCLAGCGDSTGSGSTTSKSTGSATGSATSAASSTSTGDTYNISFIVKLTDGHFQKVIAGAEAYAAEHSNVKLEVLSPTSATAYDEQINMIETSLGNDSVDAIIISPLQSDSAATLVADTAKPIIACDTDFTSDKKLAFVGTGNEDAAKSGGKSAAEEAIKRGSKKVTAVVLTGVQGDETHDARLKGYQDGIKEAGGEVLEVQYCDAQADKAVTAMEAIIQKHPDGVDVVCSTNDDMVMAAAKAIADSGNTAFANTVLCGFDGNQSAIEAVQSGTIAMDVAQLGYDMGYKSVEAAVDALEGKTVESFIDSGSKIVTPDNVEEYITSMKDIGVWE